jgi:hypothetical protein
MRGTTDGGACAARGAAVTAEELRLGAARGSSGGPAREREVDVAAAARSGGSKRANGFVGNRAHGRILAASARAAAAAMLSISSGTPRVGAGEQQRLLAWGSAAAGNFFI